MTTVKDTYIIYCAGWNERFKEEGGKTRHFFEINGEPLIYRTIRLLAENGIDIDQIYVTSENYEIEGVNDIHIDTTKTHEKGKVLSTRHLWNNLGRTVTITGDVYFSETAIQRITSYQGKDWTLFCRIGDNRITGKHHGESFATSFYPKDHKLYEEARKTIQSYYDTGIIERTFGWDWETSRYIGGARGKDVTKHHDHLSLYEIIDDITDDIDNLEQLKQLREALNV